MSQDGQRRSLLAAFTLLLPSMCPVTIALAADTEPLADKVGRVREWQGEAEAWVRKIKANGKLSPAAVAGARDHYDAARAAIEAWRLALKTDLAQDLAGASANQEARLKQAAEKVSAFMHYAEGILTRGGGASAAGMLGQMVSVDLTSLVLGLMGMRADRAKQSREEVNKILDQLEWRTFESVK